MRTAASSIAAIIASLLVVVPAARPQDDASEQRAIAVCPGFALWVEAQKAAAARRPQQAPPPDAPALSSLRTELLAMQVDDQRVRESPQGGPPPMQPLLDVDARHLPRIKAIVEKYGFPTRAQIESDGMTAAWLLVQHATRDPAFQARVLKQIEPRVKSGEIGGEQFALLTDRVLILNEHKRQRYGSQLDYVDGRYIASPVEDAARVDAWRAQFGMAPLQDYVCFVNALQSRAPH